METPFEVMFQVLSGLDYQSILNYCLTHKRANEICNSKFFFGGKRLSENTVFLEKHSTELICLLLKYILNILLNMEE